MRLSPREQKVIHEIVLDILPKSQLYLFGSRVDDSKRGGDIDLLVITTSSIQDRVKRNIILKLEDVLGEQKIDLLVIHQKEQPFIRHILELSIPL